MTDFPFQTSAISFLTTHPRALLALSPGLGKTYCAIQAAVASNFRKVLIVCPLTLMEHWYSKVKLWANITPHTLYPGNKEGIGEWNITNYDTVIHSLDRFIKLGRIWDVLIIDESILVKNRKSQRYRAIKTLAYKAKHVWELSGAPTTKFYDDLWSQFNILSHKNFRSYWRFAGTYCDIDQGYWGWKIEGNKPSAHLAIKKDCADFYYCRSQDEVLDLPEFLKENLEVKMRKGQSKLYEEMEDHFFATLPEGDVVLAPNILAKITRLIQLASNPLLLGSATDSAKWCAAIELLEFVEYPVILWTNYIHTAQKMYEYLLKYYNVRLLTGITPHKDRQGAVDSLQAGKVDILVAHPAVGKFGLNLQKARTAIYLERSFNGDDYYQSLYRIRRIGTTNRPYIVHLLSLTEGGEPTIDHIIHNVLEYRRSANYKLTTNDLRKFKRRQE